jgi:predicted signal transduction protein with EAL and GGDEF domain
MESAKVKTVTRTQISNDDFRCAKGFIDLDAFHRIADAMRRRCIDHMLVTVFPSFQRSTNTEK